MPENQNIEWKERWKDEYLKWVCGFANASGGTIFIGKNDDGIVVGLKSFNQLLEDIPNKIISHLGVVANVDLQEESGLHFIEISVPSYDVPISYHGKYYYRSGSTKQELTGNALNEFLLRKMGKTWDDIVDPNASIEDIDEKAVLAFKQGAQKSGRLPQAYNEVNLLELLQNLRLADGAKLKRSAVLLFGKDPRNFFINAFVKIGRFGKTDDELLSQDVVEGNAFQLANQTLEILDKKYFTKTISYQGIQRVENTEYPYEAIREVLLNAIVHRQYLGAPIQISVYEDKFMVWNYGLLPDGISIEDLSKKHTSHPRNPFLADVFFKGGQIESWGRGTIKVILECEKAGLPKPEIVEMNGGVMVTFFKAKGVKIKENITLNKRQIEALSYWKENGEILSSLYSLKFNINNRTALRDLKELVEKGLLKKEGDLKNSRYLFP